MAEGGDLGAVTWLGKYLQPEPQTVAAIHGIDGTSAAEALARLAGRNVEDLEAAWASLDESSRDKLRGIVSAQMFEVLISHMKGEHEKGAA